MNTLPYNLDDIRAKASFPAVVELLGGEMDRGRKILCPFHLDTSKPNFHCYSDGGKCFACGKTCDIFGYVMQVKSMSFPASVKFLADQLDILPTIVVVAKNEYWGPVSMFLIDHLHTNLTAQPGKMVYLTERLIDEKTVSIHRLGYDLEKASYSIPYWQGVPGYSEADILQFRAAPGTEGLRYWGLKHHNRPSILGRYVWNPDFLLLFAGTFDALLAQQDGIPAWSVNGTEAFSGGELPRLQSMVGKVEKIIVVPDASPTEFRAAYALAHKLGGEVRFIPASLGIKDYTDYRLSGRTAEQFIEEVLLMPVHLFYALDSVHVQQMKDILLYIAQGKPEEPALIIRSIDGLGIYKYGFVLHALQMAVNDVLYSRPDGWTTFSVDEWLAMQEAFFQSRSYEELLRTFHIWAEKAQNKLGVF